MEDPEEKKTFVDSPEINEMPLTICSTVCRLSTEVPLTMRELIKTVFSIITLEFICILGIYFMSNESSWALVLGILQMLPVVVLYLSMYVNVITGGWGTDHSRFWCDVKIMYARGFNTLRSCTSFVSRSICFCFIAIVMDHRSLSTVGLLPLLAVLAEWQVGLSENKNQYDIKVFDKFMKDGHLCIESLQHFQTHQTVKKTHFTPFIAALVIKTYVITTLLFSWSHNSSEITFGIPIVCMLIFYVWCAPLLLDFMYLKSALTFCQLELARMLLDITIPVTVACFALV